jgi:hypothetical protein
MPMRESPTLVAAPKKAREGYHGEAKAPID